jgi:Holliday junction resolvasome RuvABC endonuclease subunit
VKIDGARATIGWIILNYEKRHNYCLSLDIIRVKHNHEVNLSVRLCDVIILKWVLRNRMTIYEMDYSDTGQGPIAGNFENGKEPVKCIRGG